MSAERRRSDLFFRPQFLHSSRHIFLFPFPSNFEVKRSILGLGRRVREQPASRRTLPVPWGASTMARAADSTRCPGGARPIRRPEAPPAPPRPTQRGGAEGAEGGSPKGRSATRQAKGICGRERQRKLPAQPATRQPQAPGAPGRAGRDRRGHPCNAIRPEQSSEPRPAPPAAKVNYITRYVGMMRVAVPPQGPQACPQGTHYATDRDQPADYEN